MPSEYQTLWQLEKIPSQGQTAQALILVHYGTTVHL